MTAIETETWHGGPSVPTIICVGPNHLNRDADWRLWIPPISPDCYEGRNIDNGDVMPPWGDSYWPTQQDACEFLEEYLDSYPVCGAGHPLKVLTKGTFYLTVGAEGVQTAVVMADADDAGNLDPEPFWVDGCTEQWALLCRAPITEGAKAAAIKQADNYWPCLKLERSDDYTKCFVEMQS